MKRAFSLVVLALLLSPVGTLAEEAAAPAPPATTPLLEAILCAAESAARLEELKGLEGIAEPLPANHCNAQQWCPSGCFISCQGHTSCTVTATSVKCDGVTTNCPFPGCTPPLNCQDPCSWCECRANGGTAFQCRFNCFDPPDRDPES